MNQYTVYPSVKKTKLFWVSFWKKTAMVPSLIVPPVIMLGGAMNIFMVFMWTVVIFIAFIILYFIIAWVSYKASKVELSKDHISGQNFIGIRKIIKWSNISNSKILSYGEFSYLVLKNDKNKALIYLPLFIDRVDELKEAINYFAGRDHPASIELTGYKC